uniref:Ficolin-2 n=1 Tax=Magallana gigas TaxID=29159 RepID=K1RB73_MAGGI
MTPDQRLQAWEFTALFLETDGVINYSSLTSSRSVPYISRPPTSVLTRNDTSQKTTIPTFPESTDALKDCKELNLKGFNVDGVYTIYPYLPLTTSVRVYCDMTTDGGGWTVFQHRKDGSVDFYLSWDSYKKGFGDARGEFWLGNDHLHQLTRLGIFDLYIRLEKFTGGWAYARYNNFSVADESDGYRMRVKFGSYQGNAGT